MIKQPSLIHSLTSPIISALEVPCEQDLQTIAELPNPPLHKLSLDQIYVRQCRLAGDKIDSYGGRFHTEDLPHLLHLTNGAPALIGHNREAIATARFFGGSIQEHDGGKFIVPKFYWPRLHSEASNLRLLIDTAIINEASIAFRFTACTCSICGEDIYRCEHELGKDYNGQNCFYWYDGIKSVLEGSFVYRGAEPGTGFLTHPKPTKATPEPKTAETAKDILNTLINTLQKAKEQL